MASRTITAACLLFSIFYPSFNVYASQVKNAPYNADHDSSGFAASERGRADFLTTIYNNMSPEKRTTSEISRLDTEVLKREYNEKLKLRNAMLQILSNVSPQLERRQATSTLNLDQENEDLQNGLDLLNSAFLSLYNIWAKQLPVCLDSSSPTQAPTTSTTSTLEPITIYMTTSVFITQEPVPATSNKPHSLLASSSLLTSNYSIGSTEAPRPTVSIPTGSWNGTYTNSTSQANATTTWASSSLFSPIPSSATIINGSSNPAEYVFNPMSSTNVAVYYGQSNITSSVRLDSICSDPAVDIVVLAFITSFTSPTGSGQYPTLAFGNSGCLPASKAQISAGATGLLDCTQVLAPQIQACQAVGKPILLSIGGAEDDTNTRIPDEDTARSYAETLWKLFGEGTGLESIRPFGNVTVDGFDIDNEYPDSDHYATFIYNLRSYGATASKPIYLSAAPQCPRPSQAIPLTSLQSTIDFVFVQFYNNNVCDLKAGQEFLDSISAWSSNISSNTDLTTTGDPFIKTKNGVTSPRLYIGVPSFPEGGEHAYTDPVSMVKLFQQIQLLNLTNIGGGALWTAEWAEENLDADGRSFVDVFKEDLAILAAPVANYDNSTQNATYSATAYSSLTTITDFATISPSSNSFNTSVATSAASSSSPSSPTSSPDTSTNSTTFRRSKRSRRERNWKRFEN